jgi:hypothetical protein
MTSALAAIGLTVLAIPARAEPTLNQNIFDRFFQAYADDWNPPAADPNAPAPVIRRPAPFPPQPQTLPPMPFTEWPFGGGTPIGASVPNSVVSPLMTAIAPTSVGKILTDNNIQIYGWINPGVNVSTNGQRGNVNKNANFPAAYAYTSNTVQLDQFALFVERIPDTVQQDHVDWGFRVTGIYGENYRYTTALGIASYQLQKHNNYNGYDFPMVYGELYVPGVLDGLLFRLGRFISVPDIEAQLAPNNYMYSHSMTYAYDNYTNTGLMSTLMLNKNWQVQFGVTTGTDTAPWNNTGNIRDRGVQPSYTACFRWSSDSSKDNVYTCANSINNGNFGYNNLQQYTTTWYHSFSDKWHISTEFWHMHENKTPNARYGGNNPADYQFGMFRNGPFIAQCKSTTSATCTSEEYSVLGYLNYRIGDHDNLSLRLEYFNDLTGQRTGHKTAYLNPAIGWQHWLGSTVTFRPEVAIYNAITGDHKVFDNGQRRSAVIVSADVIWHF